jgi:hypothetical protein
MFNRGSRSISIFGTTKKSAQMKMQLTWASVTEINFATTVQDPIENILFRWNK